MGCLCIMCILSLSKKTYQKTSKQHSYILLKNNPLNILCSILKTCFTRPLSCERPLKLSKDEDCLLFILACLMPSWQSCPGVSEPQILLKLMWFGCPFPLTFIKVPPWTCSFLPSFWLYRKNGTMGKVYAGRWGLLSLGHSCKALSSFRGGVLGIAWARVMRSRRRNKDLSWQ